ncbi:MAG TPA: 4Fe-4S binding protein [Planctomycetota bacterium]|nr:4Fe-4S binding protein [Planctomycetota bacterium]
MAYVVCEPCVSCKYTDCVEVCPVDCFREGEKTLYIDPEECIDCALCVPECPVEAIFADVDVPERWKGYIEINAAEAPRHPPITVKQDPLPTAPPRK